MNDFFQETLWSPRHPPLFHLHTTPHPPCPEVPPHPHNFYHVKSIFLNLDILKGGQELTTVSLSESTFPTIFTTSHIQQALYKIFGNSFNDLLFSASSASREGSQSRQLQPPKKTSSDLLSGDKNIITMMLHITDDLP